MLRSMPPVADDRSRVVILGSMPGRESLEKRQYYARKQNSFWRIVHALYDDVPSDGYEDRVDFVRQRGMALWDVLRQCEREGSSDSSITNEEVNDLERFFLDHPGIRHVFFNGKKAARSFELVRLSPDVRMRLSFTVLPSTSPANAAMRYDEKLAAWSAVRDALDRWAHPNGPGEGSEHFSTGGTSSSR